MNFRWLVLSFVAIALIAPAGGSIAAEPPAKQDEPEEVDEVGGDDVIRFFNACELVDRKEYERATADLLAMWNAEADQAEFRHTLFYINIERLKPLVQNYEPSRKAFSGIRDKLSATIRRWSWWSASATDRQDWICLNAILDQDDRTLSWFDSIKNRQGWKHVAGMVWAEEYLCTLLKDRKKWADLTLATRDPLQTIRELGPIKNMIKKMGAGGPPPDWDVDAEYLKRVKPFAPGYYIGYLQRKMPNKAAYYGEAVGAIPGSSELLMQMVELAIEEDMGSFAQHSLLDLAEKQGADVTELRAKLEAALAEKK